MIFFSVYAEEISLLSTGTGIRIEESTGTAIIADSSTEAALRLVFAGDIMIHKWQLEGVYNKDSKTYNFDEEFNDIKEHFQNADGAIGNFETTFGGENKGYRTYPTFSAPDSLGKTLKDVGFDVLVTANNHTLDSGADGIIRTLDILDKNGIEHTGSFRTIEERDTPFIMEGNGISFAIVNYTYGTNGIELPPNSGFMLNYLELDKMKRDILAAKEENPDFVIAFLHFGDEYQELPNNSQKKIVDELFLAGADIVIGSHPHVLQPMEMRKVGEDTKYVIYSMGNFISSQRTKPRESGVIVKINLKKNGEKRYIDEVNFVPTWVQAKKRDDGTYFIRTLDIEKTLKGDLKEFDSIEVERMKELEKKVPKHLTGMEKVEINSDGEYIFYKR